MKYVLTLLFIAFYSVLFSKGDSLSVRILIQEFKSDSGQARILIFDQEEGFPSEPEEALFRTNVKIKSRSAEIEVKLKSGEYAVSVHHDENNNDEIDTTWYGKPVEGFGVTNEPKSLFGPPDYEDCTVEISTPKILKIKMKYF